MSRIRNKSLYMLTINRMPAYYDYKSKMIFFLGHGKTIEQSMLTSLEAVKRAIRADIDTREERDYLDHDKLRWYLGYIRFKVEAPKVLLIEKERVTMFYKLRSKLGGKLFKLAAWVSPNKKSKK